MANIESTKLMEGIATVCYVCRPKETVFNSHEYAHWKGLGIVLSHGVCQGCAPGELARIRAGMEKIRAERNPVTP